MKNCLRCVICFMAITLIAHRVSATHLRAADILVEKVNCSGLRYKITLRVYVNTLSSTPVGGGANPSDGNLTFGDGTSILIPQLIVTPRSDLGTNIGIASAEFFHTYATEGTYRINYYERDRSGGVINIAGAFDVAYSTYIEIHARSNGCNHFPTLTVAPLDRGCRGSIFYHSPGAVDEDGDSLSYALTVPSQDVFQFVNGYLAPDNKVFYPSNFNTANEAGDGPPSFAIDPVTGLITWDAPGMQGEYNIAFKILEWRKNPVTDEFELQSETIRDMQIVIEDCSNRRPRLVIPQNVCIEAGKTLTGKIIGTDPENNPVKIEAFSAILTGPPESLPATITPLVNDFVPSVPAAELNFEWKTDCIHVRDQTYQVVFKITNKPPSGPRLVTYRTWDIKVIAPKPQWIDIAPDLVKRTAKLKWDSYVCQNAEKIEIWRKVGSSPFSPGPCVAGLSKYKGYQLIATVPPNTTEYEDTNNGRRLSVGAQYCYRLVASFASPAGGKSYVSDEACLEPIQADAPVITNVSVIKTSNPGVIKVKWLAPFDIDKSQYPEPYQYEVYRGDGFIAGEDLVNISGKIADNKLEFDDMSADAEGQVYNYTVVLYSKTRDVDEYNAIDTSATASTVRLSAEPSMNQIKLTWSADVPWSNVVDTDPWHYIYRGFAGTDENLLELIDSVNVTESEFEYLDVGPLRGERKYSYKVITKGTYGNNKIGLLLNKSQQVSMYPDSDLPACVPVLNVTKNDCDTFTFQSCTGNDYLNILNWEIPQSGEGCRADFQSFNVYYATSQDAEYVLLKENVVGSSYKDEKLLSFARCYKIAAMDGRGVMSAMSEPSCNENCPSFELPNVFTPNGDGCNDLFSAINGMNGQNESCPPVDPASCPRFVQNVLLKVLNRWGRVVYEYKSDDQHSIMIDWNGKDQHGSLLDAGVYYYTADVVFDTMDPLMRTKRMKGTIHIVH